MFKTLILVIIIFIGMAVYDTETNTSKHHPSNNPKIEQHEKNAAKALILTLLPPQEQWPSPIQKIYLAFNMEEVIDPLRESPDWTPLPAIPKDLQQAIISIEDHNFYEHGAIAFEGVLRAALVNISAGEILQGGSTLTQQFVKNVFLTHEQSMERKIEEAVLSLMLEENYSKDEILELYLNTTYFGAGANGLKQAAKIYFDKSPQALTLEEAAVIAALPYAPSALNPLENPEGCKKRQLLVLQTMQKYGFINQDRAAQASAATIHLANGTTM